MLHGTSICPDDYSQRRGNIAVPHRYRWERGYIKANSSAIKKQGAQARDIFTTKVIADHGLLEEIAFSFSSRTEFEGDLNEKVILERDSYVFQFHIRKYERDSDHEFMIIYPEYLRHIPDYEELGRIAYLTIEPAKAGH